MLVKEEIMKIKRNRTTNNMNDYNLTTADEEDEGVKMRIMKNKLMHSQYK